MEQDRGGKRGGGRGGRGGGGRGGRGGRGRGDGGQQSAAAPAPMDVDYPTLPQAGGSVARAPPSAGGAGPSRQPAPQPPPPPAGGHPVLPPKGTTSSGGIMTLAKRPAGAGAQGRPIDLYVNMFPITFKMPDFYLYDVKIEPERAIVSRKINRIVFGDLVKREHRNRRLTMPQLAYDGRALAYTPAPLSEDPFIMEGAVDTFGGGRASTYTVTLTRTDQILSVRSVVRAIETGDVNVAHDEIIQAVDIILNTSAFTKYTSFGRSFFSPEKFGRGPIDNILDAWHGYFQSVRVTQGGLRLNIDKSVTAVIKKQPLMAMVMDLLNMTKAQLSNARLTRDQISRLGRSIKKIRTVTNHRGAALTKKRIEGISMQNAQEYTFEFEGNTISIEKYYSLKYNMRLNFPLLPVVQLGASSTRANFTPIECLDIDEGQRQGRKLTPAQVTAILKEACKRPNDRKNDILNVAHATTSQDTLAAAYGITVMGRSMVECKGRLMMPPALEAGKKTALRVNQGTWNMVKVPLKDAGKALDRWLVVSFDRLHPGQIDDFMGALVQMARTCGVNMAPRPSHPHIIESPRDLDARSTQMVLKKHEKKLLDVNFIFFIFRDALAAPYGEVKRMCETVWGKRSQCMLSKHVRKGDQISGQYTFNIMLKINTKLGGRNFVLVDELNRRLTKFSETPTLIFGADVSHAGPGSSLPSIASVVACPTWPEMKYFRALCATQQSREEIVADLYVPARGSSKPTGFFIKHLSEFYANTRQKPNRIIYYRDGVGDGQFATVLYQEVNAMREACKCMPPVGEYAPKITFVIVQKRHHVRFFPKNVNDADRSGNVPPGVVIDTDVVGANVFDFFLYSHAGIQGTSRPCRYQVLFDENNFTLAQIEKLTYDLCHTYARCTRSVSIVPPAYYAHHAAKRMMFYLGDQASDYGSISSGGSGGGMAPPVLPEVLPELLSTMFYL